MELKNKYNPDYALYKDVKNKCNCFSKYLIKLNDNEIKNIIKQVL